MSLKDIRESYNERSIYIYISGEEEDTRKQVKVDRLMSDMVSIDIGFDISTFFTDLPNIYIQSIETITIDLASSK